MPPTPKTALCYIRLSVHKDGDDPTSPDRQRDHIRAVCAQHGWQCEWYEDVGGHRSGTSEKQRPAWRKLKARLGDPDIAALVGNDLSRFHRKGWRVGELLALTEDRGVRLILADPSRQIDFSTPLGRTLAQFIAMLDEWYAMDASLRAKSSAAHRKARGISVGIPPFGTVRGPDGYLIPSPAGAWRLPDGSAIGAPSSDEPPHPDAVWRGYYQATAELLQLYAQGNIGMAKISDALNARGYCFRNRKDHPVGFEVDDVRRVVANWAEYGGVVSSGRAHDAGRHAALIDPDSVKLLPDRAVFPVELLSRVGQVRRLRTNIIRKRTTAGNTRAEHALSGLLVCADCARAAAAADDPGLLTRYKSKKSYNGRAALYLHREGVVCLARPRSVLQSVVHDAVLDLLRCFQTDDATREQLSTMAIHHARRLTGQEDLSTDIQARIDLARKAIANAKQLALRGEVSVEDAMQAVDQAQETIRRLEAAQSEDSRVALEVTLGAHRFRELLDYWEVYDDLERNRRLKELFRALHWDAQAKRLVQVEVASSAEPYIVMLATHKDIVMHGNLIELGYTSLTPAGQLIAEVYSPDRALRALLRAYPLGFL